MLTFVAPDGARSASAGVFVMMASDLAAMAPQTNIGSSTPVAAGADIPDGDLKRKIVNDAVARIRVLADDARPERRLGREGRARGRQHHARPRPSSWA